MENRKRAVKVSLQQQNIMVDYMCNHRKMLIKSDNLSEWTDLSRILNSVKGATKTAEQWRRSFIEWKSKVKKKARTIAVNTQKTGGGIDHKEELTDTENKLISLIGTASVLGDSQLKEGGIEDVQLLEKERQHLEPTELNLEQFQLEFINEKTSSSDVNETVENIVIEVDETDVTMSDQTSEKKKGTKRKAGAKNYSSKKKLLPSALNEYSQSTEKFTTSTDRLAVSIDRLATSNFALAESLSKENK